MTGTVSTFFTSVFMTFTTHRQPQELSIFTREIYITPKLVKLVQPNINQILIQSNINQYQTVINPNNNRVPFVSCLDFLDHCHLLSRYTTVDATLDSYLDILH